MDTYAIKTGSDGYIESIQKSDKGIEINVKDLRLDFLNCYKVQDEKIVLDQGKMDSLIAQDEKIRRIAELRQLITESDDIMSGFLDDMASLNNPVTFIADFIKLIANINTKYAQLIIDRKAWREELESLLK